MAILYAQHFRLREAPFSIAPNPRFLFMSEQHREALAHLLYGIEHDGGFVLLTGEVGTGKTTLCRCLLEKMPADVDVAFIINPRLSVVELLANICDELGIEYPRGTDSNRLLVDAINHYLLARHAETRKTVLIIDEAQNLDADVLEQLRLLTNLETDERKLLQIILLGQPELQHKLAQNELRQLSQRITARYHLTALGRDDIHAYITHRLSVAGCEDAVFTSAAERFVHKTSQGIPRLVNLICDRAMLGAYAAGVKTIIPAMTRKAADEVLGEQAGTVRRPHWKQPLMWSAVATCLILAVLFLSEYSPLSTGQQQPPAAAEPPPAPPGSATDQAVHNEVPTHKEALRIKHQMPEIPETTAWNWPSDIDPAQSRQLAFRALFQVWGTELPDTARPCVFATSQSLACLKQVGDLGLLRSLNRPAVLPWQTDTGDIVHITVLSISGTAAQIVMGNQQVKIPLPLLRQHWLESFTLLWRTPEAYTGDILPGTAGPSARWLNGRLEALEPGMSLQRIPGIYQGEWILRLRRFQRDAGLLPDGAAGPQTLIRLNTVMNEPGPRLIKPGKTAGQDIAGVTPAATDASEPAGTQHVLHP